MRLKARAEELLGRKLPRLRVFEDTTRILAIDQGDVVSLQGRHFLIKGYTYEGRFGLDEQPKPWVRHGVDLADGLAKIIKFVFFEEFFLPLGSLRVRCYRSPEKEARILELVRGQRGFMQGVTLPDAAGNLVRVLDPVWGTPLDQELEGLEMDHLTYFHQCLPGYLERLIAALEGIAFLHTRGERHGDIRRDHLYVENDSGLLRWIDFDYNFNSLESPYGLDLFGLGNVLCFLVGRGIPTRQELERYHPLVMSRLSLGDYSPVIKNRVFNLKLIYPYIPSELNRVLMHFANSSPVFYERVEEMLDDLRPVALDLLEAAP